MVDVDIKFYRAAVYDIVLVKVADDELAYLRAVIVDGAKEDALSSLETNVTVTEILDAARRSAREGRTIQLPKSNVLQFILADGSKISARPSGTEPKIKFYFSVKTTLASAGAFDKVNGELSARIDGIIHDMKL